MKIRGQVTGNVLCLVLSWYGQLMVSICHSKRELRNATKPPRRKHWLIDFGIPPCSSTFRPLVLPSEVPADSKPWRFARNGARLLPRFARRSLIPWLMECFWIRIDKFEMFLVKYAPSKWSWNGVLPLDMITLDAIHPNFARITGSSVAEITQGMFEKYGRGPRVQRPPRWNLLRHAKQCPSLKVSSSKECAPNRTMELLCFSCL